MTARWNYWNGPDEEDRRETYVEQFKPEYQASGDDVQRRIAAVETAFRAETQVELPEGYASGWRPPSVNEVTANAGKLSAHLEAQAGDKRDAPLTGAFAWWCMRHLEVLEQHQLYMEHPVATVLRAYAAAKARAVAKSIDPEEEEPTPWCHLTTRAPVSHDRVYWPDLKAKSEWEAFLAAGGQEGASYGDWQALGLAKTEEKKPSRKPRREE